MSRELNFGLAINEAIKQSMESDPDVMLIGQGVESPWYVGNTCKDLIKLFGKERVIDTPVSENAMTGAAVGAAIAGMKSIVVHPRVDFAMYALDPIINQASNWHYMSGGRSNVPVVFWLIINRGGEQGAQHSQALHSIFAHIPGLKVIAPSSPYDVKGVLTTAINEKNPIVFIDDRELYNQKEVVPKESYQLPIGKGRLRKEGKDLTIVSFSALLPKSLAVAEELKKTNNIDAEVIDLISIKPFDKDLVINSVKKTKRVLIVDGSWEFNSITAEIAATVYNETYRLLKKPVKRLNLPDCPTPAAASLEDAYYLNKDNIKQAIIELMK